jgi:branched-chain amino acid transport system substrate-binding protein
MDLVALAIEQAKSTDGDAIRTALEDLKASHQGLIKAYNKPFAPDNHDALGAADYIMVHYDGDNVVPVY